MRQLVHQYGGTHNPLLGLNGHRRTGGYAEFYALLWSLYYSDTYDDLASWASTLGVTADVNIHAIRNPTARTIEVYAAHLWPGTLPDALPIVSENQDLPNAIQQVWEWSNWASEKQAVARSFPLLGDWFVKVPQLPDGRPYLQTIDPANVVDFDKDTRGNITWIRIDVPQRERAANGELRTVYHVEVWDKGSGRFRVWRADRPDIPLDQLGTPVEDRDIEEFGIDFVPFVHQPFRHVGEQRGVGAITLAFRKVVEADLIATQLHQRLFRYNKADWVLSSAGRDASGRPIPPPDIQFDDSAPKDVDAGGETLVSLPAGWDLRSLIANINYDAALRILNAHIGEIENDLPELAFYRLRDLGNPSGRAVRLLLSDAIGRINEARGNAEAALIKAQKMALTMGAQAKLPEFKGIGTYEDGSFEHSFAHREVVDLPESEIAEMDHNRELALQLKLRRGYSKRYLLQRDGIDDDTINQMEDESAASGDALGSAVLRAFNAGEF